MKNKPYLQSSPLYTKPSVSKGIARTLDVFGTLNEYNTQETEEEADTLALERDWKIVGIDLHNSIENYEKEQESLSPTNTVRATI